MIYKVSEVHYLGRNSANGQFCRVSEVLEDPKNHKLIKRYVIRKDQPYRRF
jgi:hypothetical protein